MKLVEIYRKESYAKVRLLLVIRVVDDGELPAHVAKELHRSTTLNIHMESVKEPPLAPAKTSQVL